MMMMMMVVVMMLIVMQQSQLFFVVLELKHVRGFSQDQQVGGIVFFLSSFLCSDNQQRRNIELTKKQRRLCGSLEEGGSTELS